MTVLHHNHKHGLTGSKVYRAWGRKTKHIRYCATKDEAIAARKYYLEGKKCGA